MKDIRDMTPEEGAKLFGGDFTPKHGKWVHFDSTQASGCVVGAYCFRAGVPVLTYCMTEPAQSFCTGAENGFDGNDVELGAKADRKHITNEDEYRRGHAFGMAVANLVFHGATDWVPKW